MVVREQWRTEKEVELEKMRELLQEDMHVKIKVSQRRMEGHS